MAFVDILGIGSLMKNNYTAAADKIEDLQEQIAITLRVFSDISLDIRSFSDSVFISRPLKFIVEESTGDLTDFCMFVSALMSNCLQQELPLRGAISIGKLIKHSRNLVGRANFLSGRSVWETVKWEEKQDWVGIVFVPHEVVQEDNSTSLYYTRASYYVNALEILEGQGLIVRYNVPLSGQPSLDGTLNAQDGVEQHASTNQEIYALRWPRLDCENHIRLIGQVIQQLGNQNLVPKYENTLSFVRFCARSDGGDASE